MVVAIVALYFLLPQIAGLEETWRRLEDGSPIWLGLALGFTAGMFGGYVLLFHGVYARAAEGRLTVRESYQICMAGLAATRLFSAGGAGGIVLTAWALRPPGCRGGSSRTRRSRSSSSPTSSTRLRSSSSATGCASVSSPGPIPSR